LTTKSRALFNASENITCFKLFLLGFVILQHGFEGRKTPEGIHTFVSVDKLHLKHIIVNDTIHHSIEQLNLVLLDKNQRGDALCSSSPGSQFNFCFSIHFGAPNMELLLNSKLLINVDQSSTITWRFLDSLSSTDDFENRDLNIKWEFMQFLHNGIILFKQSSTKNDESGKLIEIVSLFLGLLQPNVYSSLTSYFNNTVIVLCFPTTQKTKSHVSLVFDNSSTNQHLHCFPMRELGDNKAILVGTVRFSSIDDVTYTISHAPTCKYSLSTAPVEKFSLHRKKSNYTNLLNAISRLKQVAQKPGLNIQHFPWLVLGSVMNTFEPSLWQFSVDHEQTMTLIRKDSSHLFVMRVSQYNGEIVLPKTWNFSTTTAVNVVYNIPANTIYVDFLKRHNIVTNNYENQLSTNFKTFPSIRQHTLLKENITYISFYNIISKTIDFGLAETFGQLVHLLAGYFSTYGEFKMIEETSEVSFFISLYENSDMILRISESADLYCVDIIELLNKLEISLVEDKHQIKLISVKITSNFLGRSRILSYESTLLYNVDKKVYLGADDSFKILVEKSVGNQEYACLQSFSRFNVRIPEQIYEVSDHKFTGIDMDRKIASTLDCFELGEGANCSFPQLFSKDQQVFVDPASYWYMLSVDTVVYAGSDYTNTFMHFKCQNNVQTANISPKMAPLWIFAADRRIRRSFAMARKSKTSLFHNECSLWSNQVELERNFHVIIHVASDYYERLALIYRLGRPNVQLARLGKPLNLDSLFWQFVQKTTRNISINLEVAIVDKREKTILDCTSDLSDSKDSKFNISCLGSKCTSYVIIRLVPDSLANNTRRTTNYCNITFNLLHGDTVLINSAPCGSLTHNILGNGSSLRLHITPDDDEANANIAATINNHVIVINKPFTDLSSDFSGHSTTGKHFRLCYNNQDGTLDFCPLQVDMTYKLMASSQNVPVTVEFSDNVHCLLDLFQTICTGQAPSSDLIPYKAKYETLSVNLQALVRIVDEVNLETYTFCGPNPPSASFLHSTNQQQAIVTWWQVYKNDPTQTSHFFSTTNSLGTFYDIKIGQPNNRNAFFSYRNTIHLRETPEKLAIVISLRRVCWQMKERQNQLELVWYLSPDTGHLLIDLLNKGLQQQGRRESLFKVGQIVIHDLKTSPGLLDKICLELETFMQFRFTKNTATTQQNAIQLVPMLTNVDHGTDLIVLQPESSVRHLDFLVRASVFNRRRGVDLYRTGTHLVVSFKKYEVEQVKPLKLVVFALLLVRYFETIATTSFQHIRLAFLNCVFVFKKGDGGD